VGLLQLNRNIGPQYGVTASVPIFNGGNTNREIKNAHILQESGQIRLDQTKADIKASIYRAFVEYQAQLTLLNLETQNLEVARKNEFAALERYKVGNLSDIDYRLAQLSLRDSEIRLLDAQYNAKRSETELLRLSGQLGKQ
jgi:outer membrane protein TolC